MTFAREAWPFVVPFFLGAILLYLSGLEAWALGALAAAVLLLLFFRNPERRSGSGESAVLAPADGLVIRVERLQDPEVGPGTFHRVVTFLSIFDVHVQRVPASGEVILSRYTPGRKVAAFRADAGTVNENQLTVIRRPNGDLIGVRQIAGLLARRVVCYLEGRGRVERGELMGIIKFGSRVDLMVPSDYRLCVDKGQRVKNGLSIVARPREAR